MSDPIPDRTVELAALHAEVFGTEPEPGLSANGHHPAPPSLNVAEIIRLGNAEGDGGKFRRLMAGDTTGYSTPSEADAALACKVVYYSRDPAVVYAVIQQSVLFDKKWERAGYRESTINGALALVRETYSPGTNGYAGDWAAHLSPPPEDEGWPEDAPETAPGGGDSVTAYPDFEDRGRAMLSDLGTVEYIEDLVRPGRIVVVAAEEASGKSYAITGELLIRLAVAGGTFAQTWRVLQTGPVAWLSEMHSDDDYLREEEILAALGHSRADLAGRSLRLYIPTAAQGRPPLADSAWRAITIARLQARGVLALVVDTATAATNVAPWGLEIQAIYTGLRQMQAEYPALAVVLVVHMKKPQGRGERRISDVLGEWGRWCDVVVLMENDGASLTRTKLTVRKRVRKERRIIVTKRGGLLVDPQEVKAAGPKVSSEQVLAAVTVTPGMSITELAKVLKVSLGAASGYVATAAKDGLIEIRPGLGGAKCAYPCRLHPDATQ